MPLYQGLLISCKKNAEHSASSEIHFALTSELDIDVSKIKVRHTRVSGLVTARLDTDLDYSSIVRQLMDLEEDEPYFMHCLKIKPIQHTLDSDVERLAEDIESLDINREGSFRVTVNKRHTQLSSNEIIEPVATLFKDHEVDLEQPDWEILVEVIADQMGFSIIEPELVFSTEIAFADDIEEKQDNWFLE